MAQQAGWLSPSTGEMPKGQRGSVIINNVYSGTIEEEERGGVPVVYVAGGGHVEGIRSGCGADGG